MKDQVVSSSSVPDDFRVIRDNLAFSTSPKYVASNFRAPMEFRSMELNVEFFVPDQDCEMLVLFFHGVCESAETWTVQNLVRICHQEHWKLAVFETQGHGLSQGPMPSDWETLKAQAIAFCHHALAVDERSTKPTKRFVIMGYSMGGAMATYATQDMKESPGFLGSLLLSPGVGAGKDDELPPLLLKGFSWAAKRFPSKGILGVTPYEDPSHYACPRTSKRNHEGFWPLGTCKLMLDVTTTLIPEDVKNGSLTWNVTRQQQQQQEEEGPLFCVISGDKDAVVPITAIKKFVEGLNQSSQKPGDLVRFLEIPGGDHGLLATDSATKATRTTIEHVRAFLKECAASSTGKD